MRRLKKGGKRQMFVFLQFITKCSADRLRVGRTSAMAFSWSGLCAWSPRCCSDCPSQRSCCNHASPGHNEALCSLAPDRPPICTQHTWGGLDQWLLFPKAAIWSQQCLRFFLFFFFIALTESWRLKSEFSHTNWQPVDLRKMQRLMLSNVLAVFYHIWSV